MKSHMGVPFVVFLFSGERPYRCYICDGLCVVARSPMDVTFVWLDSGGDAICGTLQRWIVQLMEAGAPSLTGSYQPP